jgi:hypothetical protein
VPAAREVDIMAFGVELLINHVKPWVVIVY